jgi:hypothetical protein
MGLPEIKLNRTTKATIIIEKRAALDISTRKRVHDITAYSMEAAINTAPNITTGCAIGRWSSIMPATIEATEKKKTDSRDFCIR